MAKAKQPPPPPRRTPPTLTDPQAIEYVRLRLAGKSLGECSALLNLPPRTLWDLRERHDLDQLVAQLRDDQLASVLVQRDEVVRKALDRMLDMLASPDPRQWQWVIERALPTAAPDTSEVQPTQPPALPTTVRSRDAILSAAAAVKAKRAASG